MKSCLSNNIFKYYIYDDDDDDDGDDDDDDDDDDDNNNNNNNNNNNKNEVCKMQRWNFFLLILTPTSFFSARPSYLNFY